MLGWRARVRARARALWVLSGLVGTALGLVLAYWVATDTVAGRSWLLQTLLSRTTGLFGGRGTLRVGVLREISPSRIVADKVALVDSAGVPVIFAEHAEGTLDFRDLFDKAIHIGTLTLRGVRMDFRQDFTGPWNIAYIISGDTVKGPGGAPGFGDDIRVDRLELRDGVLTMIAPWAPHPVFTGSARDSVIAVRDSLHDITRTPRGLLQRRTITLDHVLARDAIITSPGQGPASIRIDSLRGTVSDPPVRVIAGSGTARWKNDSLRFEMPLVRLPASSGTVAGLLHWDQPGPLRYDVVIDARAGLSDLGWIWNVLPDSGTGTATVHMRTLVDANDTEFMLSKLDVSTMDSRVMGDIGVISRPASLELRAVDLAFAPLQSSLLRRLSYDAVPETVKGVLTGRLQAESGGPLTAFRIDRLDARFVDSNVPGAVSALQLRGLVALGARPAAWDMRVSNATVDLRSVRALAPELPAIDGVVGGSARIAAADLRSADVRDIALVWTDAAGNESRVGGSARVRYGDRDPSMSLALSITPLSLSALARIDTTLPLRSNLAGSVRASGPLSSLAWGVDLSANGTGRLALDGTASLETSAWSTSARGTVGDFDVRSWLGRTDLPTTDLDGQVTFSARGTRGASGMAVAEAVGSVALAQEAAAARPGFDLLATGALDAARFRLDSATATMGGVRFDARGALARDSGAVDTMVVSLRADTLALVRPELRRLAGMLMPVDSALAGSIGDLAADTLRGDLSVSGYLFGAIGAVDATLALGARDVQVGAVRVGNVFGSFRATDLLNRPFFESAATADEIEGIGAIRISTANFSIAQASPDSGRLVLDVSSRDTTHLVMRGAYARANGALTVGIDSVRFESGGETWRNGAPIRVVSDATGLRVDTVDIRSSTRGAFSLSADLPLEGPAQARMRLDRFPVGAAAAFTLGTPPFGGGVTGNLALSGTRAAPLLSWNLAADSLGMQGLVLPRITSEGSYADRQLVARALLADTAGGALRAEARLPIDLSIREVDERLLSDAVDAEIVADSLRLHALGFRIGGVGDARGTLAGRLALAGTFERPFATGTMTLDGLAARVDALGIGAYDGRMVVRAAQDSLILESFRIRSGGPLDSIGARGAMRFASGQPATVELRMQANNMVLARRADGTDLNVSGDLRVDGPLSLPTLSGRLFIPYANLVVDPLAASTALDLGADAAREVLGVNEVPVAGGPAASLASLGRFATVSNARIDLGSNVWVRTPEAAVKVSGGLAVTTSGQTLALEGEVAADRGQYRLDLGGVVNRTFSIDSGRVRFYGSDAIPPTLDISATNVVRLSTGEEIPVRVHIGGTTERPLLALSSSDPQYATAPESEIISLLIFGAPTFALDGESQSTVRAVTGVLLPSVGGIVGGALGGALQRLVPGLTTVQLNTASGQNLPDDVQSFVSELSNVSLSAGVQLGPRTFLRVNTGVCRGAEQSTGWAGQLWGGLAVEYRISTGLSAQVGYDPGASPCTRLGTGTLRAMQFGFDLFREWVF